MHSKRDARELDHKTLEEFRFRAVEYVLEGGRPQEAARVLGVHPEVVRRWVRMYERGGWDALTAKPLTGPSRTLDDQAEECVCEIIRTQTPEDWGFDSALWTRALVGEVITRLFGVKLSLAVIGSLLERHRVSCQRPSHRAHEQDPQRVQEWVDKEYPAIRKRADDEHAIIVFGDEAGLRSDHHGGTTWGSIGETPTVCVSGKRSSCNMLSVVAADGTMRYEVDESRLTAARFIAFLRFLIAEISQKIILIVDNHPAHRAKKTAAFVESVGDRLELLFLPPYAPECNPDELLWNYVKGVVRKIVPRGKGELHFFACETLRSLMEMPAKVASFFSAPKTQYILQPKLTTP